MPSTPARCTREGGGRGCAAARRTLGGGVQLGSRGAVEVPREEAAHPRQRPNPGPATARVGPMTTSPCRPARAKRREMDWAVREDAPRSLVDARAEAPIGTRRSALGAPRPGGERLGDRTGAESGFNLRRPCETAPFPARDGTELATEPSLFTAQPPSRSLIANDAGGTNCVARCAVACAFPSPSIDYEGWQE